MGYETYSRDAATYLSVLECERSWRVVEIVRSLARDVAGRYALNLMMARIGRPILTHPALSKPDRPAGSLQAAAKVSFQALKEAAAPHSPLQWPKTSVVYRL